MAVSQERLEALYAQGDDPWGFRSSPYEAAKYAATLAALPHARYAHILEIGCGNGELARRLATRCDRYTGIDAVETALAAARLAVPEGRFVRTFLPGPLPPGAYDLIVVSEILYFLDRPGLADLAGRIDAAAPDARIVAVTWLGPSGNPLEGMEALDAFRAATPRSSVPARVEAAYRIDLMGPCPAAPGP